jgi:hypothetical protein
LSSLSTSGPCCEEPGQELLRAVSELAGGLLQLQQLITINSI